MPIKANWNYPTAVRFGAGRIAELPEALKVAGITKPLLVTDAGLANVDADPHTATHYEPEISFAMPFSAASMSARFGPPP